MMSCSVTVYYAHYLKQQQVINQRLADQYLAESLVALSKNHDSEFNYGKTKRVSPNIWRVTLSSGRRVNVHYWET